MADKTSNLRDVVNALHHIADLFAEDVELDAPVSVNVRISTGYAGSLADRAAIDKLAAALGVAASFKEVGGGSSYYQATASEGVWSLTCASWQQTPDPAEELRRENEKLRKALTKIKKIASKHTEVDGCECEDCAEMAGA
jgi:hypothetical protein